MSKDNNGNGLLIIEGSYLSSIVSAHTSTNGKVSTSASYNYELAEKFFGDNCEIDLFYEITFCDALPYDDGSQKSYDKIFRVKKYHKYLRRIGIKVKLGRTEKVSDYEYRQTGVNSEIIDTLCYYHGRYSIDLPILIVSADRTLYSCIKRLVNEGRKIILIGSDDENKNLYFKPSLRNQASRFVNLSTDDVLKFKNKPGFVQND